MLPLATAVAGPVEDLVGRGQALWGCAVLVVLVTGAVLFVPDVRNLTRRTAATAPVAAGPSAAAGKASSADAESAVGRLG